MQACLKGGPMDKENIEVSDYIPGRLFFPKYFDISPSITNELPKLPNSNIEKEVYFLSEILGNVAVYRYMGHK